MGTADGRATAGGRDPLAAARATAKSVAVASACEAVGASFPRRVLRGSMHCSGPTPVATGKSGGSAIVVRVGEEECGLGEDVAPEFALVDLIDAAESRLGVVEPDGGGSLPDGSLVWPFDLDERREAGPGVEVKSDLPPAPLLAVILL